MEKSEKHKTLRAIIISLAAIICMAVAAYSYYQSNRYQVERGFIFDKYEGTYSPAKFVE
jgi:hypothetical protein